MNSVFFVACLLFLFVVKTTHASDSLCPTGWSFSANTSFCYTLSTNYMPFSEASSYCQSIGGSQAFITTSRDIAFIATLTGPSLAQPWLATTRNTTNNRWYNPDGTTTWTYYWLAGEPSVNGDCSTFRGAEPNGMRATQCWSMQPALCRQMPALCPTKTQYGGMSTRSGTITSPGYPQQYYNNLDCWYTITSPVNTYITIYFSPYLVESDFDYIDVYDGPNSTYRYLGTTDDWYDYRYDFESSNNSMSFKFHTDRIITDKGWLATWSAKSNVPPIRQTGQNGSFTSPNYPNNYDPYTEQLYYFTAPTGFKINLNLDNFITEANYDVLEIYNASYVSQYTLVANLSGSSVAPWSWTSPGAYVTMRFKSDAIVQKQGFTGWWILA